jgi:predicted glycoside hydrolase/deacetylase ChbG (UPF0249 family)
MNASSSSPARTLIVNADDFGFSPQVNAGILEAFTHGVVTDTSVLIFSPHAANGLKMAKEVGLPVGVHVDFVTPFIENRHPSQKSFFGPNGLLARELYEREFQKRVTHPFSCEELIAFRDALRYQVETFVKLAGNLPTHLDYHFGLHHLSEIMAIYVLVADDYSIPVRWGEQYAGKNPYLKSPQLFVDGFRGLPDGSVQDFTRLLDCPWSGTLEICCHPGHFTPQGLPDSYNQEREYELSVLTEPHLKEAILAQDITLVNYNWLREITPEGFTI